MLAQMDMPGAVVVQSTDRHWSKDIANKICDRFGKAGADFLRPVYEEHQH
ncbi:MAG: hypothetical protein OXG97_07540 [Candidatus Poribacteria bacterium]|nr:hypothetical protein [Candidatus Poribacteria bacterium]